MRNPRHMNTQKLDTFSIPQEYHTQLDNIRAAIEEKTGEVIRFTVERFDKHPLTINKQVIGDFATRSRKVVVYDMLPEYSALDGVYDSFVEMEKARLVLCGTDYFYDIKNHPFPDGATGVIGKCKTCHSYNDPNPQEGRGPNYTVGNCQTPSCESRRSWTPSKWTRVRLSTDEGKIVEINSRQVIGRWKHSA